MTIEEEAEGLAATWVNGNLSDVFEALEGWGGLVGAALGLAIYVRLEGMAGTLDALRFVELVKRRADGD
jgi:hypothetical protein